jgi:glycosyltransferase involved in cell wall biosynthesis
MPEVKKEWDVLFTGRQVPEKGVDMITRACQQLSMSFEIVSDRSYFELPEIYNKAKIFCSFPIDTPIWREQSGSYTNLEAQACKIPVVTSNAGAIPEYLKDTAIICKQGDVEDLKKGLLNARNSEEETKLRIEAAYENFIENYSTTAVARKLYDAFKQIMSVKDFF